MAHRAEKLVRLPADVTRGASVPATPVRAELGDRLRAFCAFALDDTALAKAIQREIRASSPTVAEWLLSPVRRTPTKWFPYGHRGVHACVETIYLLGPPREPERWVAVGSAGREPTWSMNGTEDILYTAVSGFFWDRDENDHSGLMSIALAQDLGAQCAAEALAFVDRARPEVTFAKMRAECREPAYGWANMRATDAFCDEFKRVVEEARATPGFIPGVTVTEALIATPWAWR